MLFLHEQNINFIIDLLIFFIKIQSNRIENILRNYYKYKPVSRFIFKFSTHGSLRIKHNYS